MKKPKITEGKWSFEKNSVGVFQVGTKFITPGNAHPQIARISTVYFNDYVRKANAQAISAVPEMLDSLMELVFLNQCDLEGVGSGMPKPEQWRKAFYKAERALKSAGVKFNTED